MSSFVREGFHACVYIPGRNETLDSCVERTQAMFQLLQNVDSSFSQWFAKGWTRKEALKHRLDLDRAEMTRAFERQKVGDAIWYSLSAWNGLGDDEASGFYVSCGHSDLADVGTLDFSPHEAGPTGERLIRAPVMTALLRALALAWDPQVGIVMSHRHRQMAFKDAAFEERIGWINYFSRSLGPLPPLPDPVRTEPMDDLGTLVILTPERFNDSNPDHVALSLQVSHLLKGAGVLKPLTVPSPAPREGRKDRDPEGSPDV